MKKKIEVIERLHAHGEDQKATNKLASYKKMRIIRHLTILSSQMKQTTQEISIHNQGQ